MSMKLICNSYHTHPPITNLNLPCIYRPYPSYLISTHHHPPTPYLSHLKIIEMTSVPK